MVNIPKLAFILGILLLMVPFPVSGMNWTVPELNDNSTAPVVDIVNSTYTQPWMYFLMVLNKTSPWEFPVIGFAQGTMGPFVDAFDGVAGGGLGAMVYLILWGVFILMVWRQSGKITIPAMIACVTAGAWGLLFPESAQPWVLILLVAAIASQLFTFFAKE